eukprot:1080390-Pleurochrysis_carterae.AAC.1
MNGGSRHKPKAREIVWSCARVPALSACQRLLRCFSSRRACVAAGGLATAALGRALTCSLLVAEGLKDGETFQ